MTSTAQQQPLPHQHSNQHCLAALQQELGQVSDFQILADLFKQLGDPNRIRIFWLLCHCEECVMNISTLLSMSSPAVSHHLRLLKSSNLIQSTRKGKEVFYTACDTEQSKLLHNMINQTMQISCPANAPCIVSCPGPEAHSHRCATMHTDNYTEEQHRLSQQVHSYLLEHLDQKMTIEALAQQFATNTTTLKESFKAVYGTSLAAHINEHRMQLAAELLSTTDDTIARIAQKTGYESQSRFSNAFKKQFDILPSRYRTLHRTDRKKA